MFNGGRRSSEVVGMMTDRLANENKELRDLGFGARVADHSSRRLLNQDGSFNTIRQGVGITGSLSLYHTLLTMSWPACRCSLPRNLRLRVPYRESA